MSAMPQEPTLRTIYQARRRIGGIVQRTPLVQSTSLSALTGRTVWLKLENVQETGAFKLRGAANRLLGLSDAARKRGVITVSTGNHGKAVAHVGRRLGVPVTVCVPEQVLAHKIEAMRALGAQLLMRGATQEEAERHAAQLAADQGLTLISPFDDPAVIAGQGTIALELLEELPEVTTVVCPLSGGGLLGGIALALKAADAMIRTVGVSMARGPVMIASIAAGHPVDLPEEPTLADSLMGGIGLDNRYTFDLIRRHVDAFVTLTEAEIAAAMQHALRVEHQVVEGGGAVGIGAVLQQKAELAGDNIVVIVSGGNADFQSSIDVHEVGARRH